MECSCSLRHDGVRNPKMRKNALHALCPFSFPSKTQSPTASLLKNPRNEKSGIKNSSFCQIIKENASTRRKSVEKPAPKNVFSEIPLKSSENPLLQLVRLPALRVDKGLKPLSVGGEACSLFKNLKPDIPFCCQCVGWKIRPPPWPLLVSMSCSLAASPRAPPSRRQSSVMLSGCSWDLLSGRAFHLQRWLLCPPFTSLHFYINNWSDDYPSHTIPPSSILSLFYHCLLIAYCLLLFDLNMASSSTLKGKEPLGDGSSIPQPNAPLKGPAQGKTGEIPSETNPPVDGASGSKPAKKKKGKEPKVNMQKLKEIQCSIQENIQSMNSCSLHATIIGDPVEAREVRKRIRMEWKFLEGGFQLVPVANKWFELVFDLPADRDKVWNRRPFHISGQLLLIRPWSISFDPWNESVSRLDLWVRLPGLPAKYVSDSILTSLIEENKIGKVLRVAAFSTKGARLRYPRICISTDLTLIRERKVTMLNENGVLEKYPVWFEDFPEGCGSCGALDHQFVSCPLRRVCNAPGEGVLGMNPSGENMGDEDPNLPERDAWVQVAARKAPPPSFGHSKEALWSCFGKNVVESSDSSSDDSASLNDDESTTLLKEPAQEDEVFSTPLVVQAPAVTPDAAPPNDEEPLPTAVIDFLDPEMYNSDDDELMEYEDDAGLVEGFSGIPADMTQADFDTILANIPASEEFELPPLSNPARRVTDGTLPSVAPPALPSVGQQLQQLRVEDESRSESGKKRLGEEEGESASSDLMGGGSKRCKHGQ